MTLVLDASAIVSWMMPDEGWIGLDQIAAGHDQLIAPWLLWSELRNVLLVNERRGRLAPGSTERSVQRFDMLGVVYDGGMSSNGTIDLARRHGLTVYDATYLECALRHGADIATRDTALFRAASDEGLRVHR